MIKKICFFSAGFAFNRLNRLRYYEKIFPKEVEIFLYTTNKYEGKESENYQHQWEGLKRTKMIVADYNLNLPFAFRKFCKDNKIDRIVNLGNRKSLPLFLFASFFNRTKYVVSLMGGVPDEESIKRFNFSEIRELLFFYILGAFAEKVITNDYGIYKRYALQKPMLSRMFISADKVRFLPVTANTNLFVKRDKNASKKKLGFAKYKKIAIFVGRTARCADILAELIKSNKDIMFIVIGRMTDNILPKLKEKNFIHIPKKSPEELVDYYNASDIHIALHDKTGAGLGLAAEESLSCGVATIVPFTETMAESPALFKIKLDKDETEKTIQNFFKKSEKEREKISKEAREYAVKNFSGEAWEENYVKDYLE